MNRKYFMLFLFITCYACSNNEMPVAPVVQEECLSDDTQVVPRIISCDKKEAINGCEKIYLGIHLLSESSKANFKDYCTPLNSNIEFQDSNGNKLQVEVSNKYFQEGIYPIVVSPDSSDCIEYCLDNEVAAVRLACDQFNVEINLVSGLASGIATPFEDHFETQYIIKAWNTINGFPVSGQTVFALAFEDANFNPIASDSFLSSLHPTILLNDEEYVDIWSNENSQVTGLVHKEKVYLSLKDGLVAVQDSLGTLWTKM